MSGGSWDYVCYKFADTASRLLQEKCPYRRALGLIINDISEAMHDIESVDSSDKSRGDEIPAIKKVVSKSDVLKVIIEDAKNIKDKLEMLLNEMD